MTAVSVHAAFIITLPKVLTNRFETQPHSPSSLYIKRTASLREAVLLKKYVPILLTDLKSDMFSHTSVMKNSV